MLFKNTNYGQDFLLNKSFTIKPEGENICIGRTTNLSSFNNLAILLFKNNNYFKRINRYLNSVRNNSNVLDERKLFHFTNERNTISQKDMALYEIFVGEILLDLCVIEILKKLYNGVECPFESNKLFIFFTINTHFFLTKKEYSYVICYLNYIFSDIISELDKNVITPTSNGLKPVKNADKLFRKSMNEIFLKEFNNIININADLYSHAESAYNIFKMGQVLYNIDKKQDISNLGNIFYFLNEYDRKKNNISKFNKTIEVPKQKDLNILFKFNSKVELDTIFNSIYLFNYQMKYDK